jgi:hypothetical protein
LHYNQDLKIIGLDKHGKVELNRQGEAPLFGKEESALVPAPEDASLGAHFILPPTPLLPHGPVGFGFEDYYRTANRTGLKKMAIKL